MKYACRTSVLKKRRYLYGEIVGCRILFWIETHFDYFCLCSSFSTCEQIEQYLGCVYWLSLDIKAEISTNIYYYLRASWLISSTTIYAVVKKIIPKTTKIARAAVAVVYTNRCES
ncbi:hypothetical protein Y032_0008g36 [Ancylostoma ceylanicum]|uniref:Uncharacterized protein n=1 Tax=Ancylostoma ceylanicum TaxID=53326 RepID=A0A016VL62_9BILA|nr:hypothetical protein Y032_0008g36 [Ancylostoma ceylanicum]